MIDDADDDTLGVLHRYPHTNGNVLITHRIRMEMSPYEWKCPKYYPHTNGKFG